MSNVTHPAHYNQGRIEVIEFIEDKGLGFHRGNAVKYIARAGIKDPGKEIEDLEKAKWYLEREIERLKARGEAREPKRPNEMNAVQPAATTESIMTNVTKSEEHVETSSLDIGRDIVETIKIGLDSGVSELELAHAITRVLKDEGRKLEKAIHEIARLRAQITLMKECDEAKKNLRRLWIDEDSLARLKSSDTGTVVMVAASEVKKVDNDVEFFEVAK